MKSVENREEKLTTMKMSIHNAEQEVVRMQSMVDALELVVPSHVANIKDKMQEIEFEDRELTEYAKARSKGRSPTPSSASKSGRRSRLRSSSSRSNVVDESGSVSTFRTKTTKTSIQIDEIVADMPEVNDLMVNSEINIYYF